MGSLQRQVAFFIDLNYTLSYQGPIDKIGLILMQSQGHNIFKDVYFQYIISNNIFVRNIRKCPKIRTYFKNPNNVRIS